jgi:competence protein ComEC
VDRGLAHAHLVVVALVTAVVFAAAAASGCGGSGGSAAAGGVDGRGSSGGTVPTTDPEVGSGGPAPATSPSPKPSASAAASAALRVVFVDVGQGDAAALRSGAWTGLVDGGPTGSEAAVGAALARLDVRRLDTLVISHLHADHTGGLPPLVRRYRPRRAWVVGAVRGSLASALRAAGTVVVQARRGLTARFGKSRATVLAPGGLSGDANTDSLVLSLQAGGRRVVFTGDSTGGGEAAAGASLARGPPVDVLKVSHHGSRSSTTATFVADARPRAAVISVGRNSYGHPTDETVQRLRRSGARVYSTQRSGSITLTVSSRGALRWSFARSRAPLLRGVSGRPGSGGSSSIGGAGGSASAAMAAGGVASGAAGGVVTGAAGGSRVFVTATGECYHRSGCRYLSSSRIATTLARAKADGYRPCSVCDPPR